MGECFQFASAIQKLSLLKIAEAEVNYTIGIKTLPLEATSPLNFFIS